MKLSRLTALCAFSVFMLGCPGNPGDYGGSWWDDPKLVWVDQTSTITPIEAGEFGVTLKIASFPEYLKLPQSKAILKGSGKLYYYSSSSEIIPYEELETYRCNGIALLYRPPAIEDVPPEGIDFIYACEVLNPLSGKWERSPDYTRRVVQRNKPMDFYIIPNSSNANQHLFGAVSDISFSYQELKVGETYERFYFAPKPLPAEGFQQEYGLIGPEGYSGNLGELTVQPYSKDVYERLWLCTYTAPEDVTSPVDIVFWVSIYDPWAKERRVRALTFHVVPKE